jgi:hypothetical protein
MRLDPVMPAPSGANSAGPLQPRKSKEDRCGYSEQAAATA